VLLGRERRVPAWERGHCRRGWTLSAAHPPGWCFAVSRLWHDVHSGRRCSNASGLTTRRASNCRRFKGKWSATVAVLVQSTHHGCAYRYRLRMFGHRRPYALVPGVTRCAFASLSCVGQRPPVVSSGHPGTEHGGLVGQGGTSSMGWDVVVRGAQRDYSGTTPETWCQNAREWCSGGAPDTNRSPAGVPLRPSARTTASGGLGPSPGVPPNPRVVHQDPHTLQRPASKPAHRVNRWPELSRVRDSWPLAKGAQWGSRQTRGRGAFQ
jgi:hypothetical protein